ncbi:MAG TPA: HD domain-containing protein [Negativicutes bacterium]|nr:HD domain-containing protein [Negativicutes bacterium]
MIRKALLELLYESAHIQRWNDHIRPKGFTELDKQAHKMIIAYVIGRFEEEDRRATVNWRALIEGGFFEFLQRIRLTDIKPPVYYELMASHGERLNRWVLAQLKPKIDGIGNGFYEKFERYLTDPEYCALEKKILKAAHYLATHWEFRIIHNLNAHTFGLDETRTRIENEIEEHYDLVGVQKIWLGKKSYGFINLVGQLRFQQRWAQSPRIPETSVMGHMLIVAMLAYILSVELGACEQRICNNYFSGLFHDLPEVLTRDIVSPVKKSVEGLEELIKQIENRQIQERLLPLLPTDWHRQIKYYIEDEFANKVLLNDKVHFVDAAEITPKYNEDRYSPIDGELIKACDHLAAYIEAKLSLYHGISSRHLKDGADSLYGLYEHKKVASIDFGQLYDYFK